ncbi:hypothetical protein BC828DRAFT_382176 [Blastocladiella britannica]|nr:hypothetical protein BC828DRAFT_382176 [Blastocladiella britannica]
MPWPFTSSPADPPASSSSSPRRNGPPSPTTIGGNGNGGAPGWQRRRDASPPPSPAASYKPHGYGGYRSSPDAGYFSSSATPPTARPPSDRGGGRIPSMSRGYGSRGPRPSGGDRSTTSGGSEAPNSPPLRPSPSRWAPGTGGRTSPRPMSPPRAQMRPTRDPYAADPYFPPANATTSSLGGTLGTGAPGLRVGEVYPREDDSVIARPPPSMQRGLGSTRSGNGATEAEIEVSAKPVAATKPPGAVSRGLTVVQYVAGEAVARIVLTVCITYAAIHWFLCGSAAIVLMVVLPAGKVDDQTYSIFNVTIKATFADASNTFWYMGAFMLLGVLTDALGGIAAYKSGMPYISVALAVIATVVQGTRAAFLGLMISNQTGASSEGTSKSLSIIFLVVESVQVVVLLVMFLVARWRRQASEHFKQQRDTLKASRAAADEEEGDSTLGRKK